ncbi:hypothetical protein EGI31_01995 [Lacihabitans soyangensis]|uniref:Carboxypeptidase-like regulatory domain-containing protein n=2 Tax=Lacihabitans soyangensis TaxID=869394 RepID=A0AAE3KRP8_9BACT|nr:hypothetical protein [Lacihabitans soyangensis]
MSSTKYILNITSPCSEKWSEMNQMDGGKYCLNCSKKVIDFTNLTDKEIVELILKSDSKICGHLKKNQTGRALQIQSKSSWVGKFINLITGLTIFSTTDNVYAKKEKFEQIQTVAAVKEDKTNITASITEKDSSILSLKGKVIDGMDKSPLQGAVIKLNNIKFETLSDLNGLFEFQIPDFQIKEKIVLEVFYVGFDVITITIPKADFHLAKNLILELTPSLSGEIIVSKSKWWKRKAKNCNP